MSQSYREQQKKSSHNLHLPLFAMTCASFAMQIRREKHEKNPSNLQTSFAKENKSLREQIPKPLGFFKHVKIGLGWYITTVPRSLSF